MIQHTRTNGEVNSIAPLCAEGNLAAIEGHEGVGEGTGGVLEGFRGVEQAVGEVEVAGLDEVDDALHTGVELSVHGERGAIFGGSAEGQRLRGDEPFVDGTGFRMLDGEVGSFAEGLAEPDGKLQGDSPTNVAGDGIATAGDRLGDVGDRGHGVRNLVSSYLSEILGGM